MGADVGLTDNSLFGFAIREENENVTISNDGSKFVSDNINISFYNTWKANDENFFDTFLSFGETNQATTRVVDVANETKVTGELKSQQAFGALKYNFAKKFNKITFSNYSSFNFSYTIFDDYSEKGDSNLRLSFDGRDLQSTSLALGTVIHADFGFRASRFLPYIKLDFNEDLSDASTLKANYVTSASNQYTTNIKKDFSSSILAETGFDWNFNNGWNLSTTLNRIEKNKLGHQNYLKFNAVRIF